MSASLSAAVERAKNYVLRLGRSNVFAYVCETVEDGRRAFEVLSDAEYQAHGNEDRCRCVVWSYPDGQYDSANVFHETGKIAAHVDWGTD